MALFESLFMNSILFKRLLGRDAGLCDLLFGAEAAAAGSPKTRRPFRAPRRGLYGHLSLYNDLGTAAAAMEAYTLHIIFARTVFARPDRNEGRP